MTNALNASFEGNVSQHERVRRQPLYAQVQVAIAEAIISGNWQAGMLIPSETEIAAEHIVSIGTVRRALGELVKSGYLQRRPRHGTFVAEYRPHHDLRMFVEFFRLHTNDDGLVTSEAKDLSLDFQTANDADAKRLHLPDNDRRVACIERVRLVNSIPVTYDMVTIPLYCFPNFPESLPLPALLYRYYEEEIGSRVTSVREHLSAVAAESRDAEILKVDIGAPLLEIEQIARDQRHQVVEIRKLRANTTNFKYINEVR